MPEASPESSLAIIVVNYGSSDLLASNLVQVAGSAPDAMVVVVDNLSTEDERDTIRSLCSGYNWTAVCPDSNTGFGGGCNIGVAAALEHGVGHILLLNPDATIDSLSLGLLISAVEAEPMTLAAPTIVRPDLTPWSSGTDLDLDRGDMRSWRRRQEAPGARTMPWLSGACLLLGSDLWRTVGGFDEDYFLYWEDVDLSARVLNAGGRLELVDNATAIHDEGGTHNHNGQPATKSPTYYYYNIRNRLMFAEKHLSAVDRRRWRRGTIGASWRILKRGGRRQFLRPRAPLNAALHGIVDGLRGRYVVRAFTDD